MPGDASRSDSGPAPVPSLTLRQAASATCGLICCFLTTLDILVAAIEISRISILFLLLYVLLDLRNIQRSQWIICGLLVAAGILFGVLAGEVVSVVADGLRGVLMFLLLFGSVTLLQHPSLLSPSMGAMRLVIRGLPPTLHYLCLATASHFLAGITNFAGFTLLSGFAMESRNPRQRLRMALALSRGFVAASTWSPFFMAIAVVVSVIPQLRWVDVALPGFGLAMLIIALGTVTDYFGNRGRLGPPPQEAKPHGLGRSIARVVALMLTLVGAVALTNSLLEVHISASIALVVTVFATIWWYLIVRARPGTDFGPEAREYARNLLGAIGSLRGMAVLFIGANIMGQGVARVTDGQMLVDFALSLGISGAGWVPFLLCLIAATSAMGLHAIILIVILGHTLPLEVIGLSHATLGLILMTSWGIGGVLSPFSTLTLYTAALLEKSNWTMAWRHNGLYALGCVALATVWITGFHYLQ